MRGVKAALAALSGGKRSSEKPSSRSCGAENENDSPHASKRLHAPGLGPSVPGSSRRGGQAFTDVTASGTPRALNYGDASPPKAGRTHQASLGRGSPSRGTLSARFGPASARTPHHASRLGSHPLPQAEPADAAAAAAEGAAGLADASDNIRVVLRVRPRSERESSLTGAVAVHPLGSTAVRVASHPEPHTFSFDYVAGDATGQETIFQVAGKPIVDNCFAGYNGCIFAYGQTGSGKTYTMLGDEEEGEGAGRGEGRGLIQRVFEHLFARIAASGGKHLLECSFLELYNETITDLLDPSRTGLAVRENLEGPYVSNLTAHEVYRVEDVVSLLHTGQANRRVGETNMNERSSRSHSVFTCKLQSKMVDAYGTTHLRTSRLHLVDLAGSERQKASGAQGERLREATAINKSLSALGNVIMSLVDQQHGRTRHVPYRDSRLTYLLQDSLGGNAKTCLVATVSPAAVNAAETLSTLRFADQAKRIKNQAVVNEDTDGDRAALKREIKRLQEELAATRRGQAQHAPPPLGLATSDGAEADAEADAAWDALPEGQEGRHAALVGALRREEAAVREAARLEAELEGMRSLLKAKDSDLQRSQMMLRLKESRLARVQAAGPALCDVPTEVAELRQEVELLRGKCDAHPEVKRFAVENLHLGEELRKLESIVRRGELAALSADVAALRSELLRSDDELARCRDEAEAARQAAQAAQAEAECAAEARAAEQASQLRQQLEEAQHAAAEREAAAAAAAAHNEELQARVALLQGAVLQLESTQADLQSELSPARKAVRRLEQDLGLARQESAAAALRASTEATLRGQAELSAGQAAARAAALEAELVALQAAQAAMERERSDAMEQAGAAASAELAEVRAELEGERTLAAQRSAEHAEAAAQLEAALRQLEAAEAQVAASQRAAAEAAAELERMRGEHEVAQAEAAARLAAALEVAGEAQRELQERSAVAAELQAACDAAAARADGLVQRCCQLQEDSARLASMLAQRNHELMELERSLEKKDAALEAATAEAERLAAGAAAAVAAAAARDKEVAADRGQVAEATAALHVAHEQLSELQERLAAADAQQAQLEFDLSDKSASLQEAAEQAAALKRQLGEAQQAQRDSEAAVAAAAAEAAAQLDASRQQSAQLATELAELEGRLEGAKAEAAEQATAAAEARQALAVAREQLAAAEADAESQRWAVGAAAVRSDELAAQLAVLRGTLLEKEQELLLGRAEAQELRQQLAEQEESAEKLRAQVAERDVDLSRLRGDMAAEVSEAAQQVQQLLAAQARAAALEAELAEARGAAQQACQLPSQVAEAVAAARAHARAELERLEEQLGQRERELAALRQRCGELEGAAAAAAGGGTAAEQLHQLIAEREGWIEEVQAQRAEATGALEALRALERRFAEVAEERGVLAAAHEELRGRAAKLEEELTAMTGQQNLQQRIHYHAQIKQEAAGLREELSRLRIEHHRAQVRCERVSQELQRVREARGQWGLPDFDAEDALRDALAATEQRKLQVELELEGLAGAVLELAAGGAAAQGGDIVLEFGTPRGERQAPTAADARRALADLAAAQAAAARAAEDQAQQIRLLREAGRLQRMRRSSGAAAAAEEQQA